MYPVVGWTVANLIDTVFLFHYFKSYNFNVQPVFLSDIIGAIPTVLW